MREKSQRKSNLWVQEGSFIALQWRPKQGWRGGKGSGEVGSGQMGIGQGFSNFDVCTNQTLDVVPLQTIHRAEDSVSNRLSEVLRWDPHFE